MTYIYILIGFAIVLVVIAIILTSKQQKQVTKDWDDYDEFEKAVKSVSTKEEAKSIYKDVTKFERNLDNPIIEIRIGYLYAFLDGFLKAKENE